MALNKIQIFGLYFLFIFSFIFIIGGCGSIKQPSGGPKDTEPPKVVEEVPKNLTRNFAAKRIEIEFDEFIKLTNEFSEISISPALDETPTFKARREVLEIGFEGPLEKNTTYTINFGKAIADVNESNVLTNYTYVFSTGNQIDSLSISGSVVSALTKEKLKDVTVFILPVSQDSLFGKKRANIFTTTDSAGNFRMQNLREDTYRVYALKEQGGDRIYNSANEEIGFLSDTILLNKNIESIQLQAFKEAPSTFTTLDRQIEADGRITFAFNRPLNEPSLEILQPPSLDARKVVEFNSKKDSAQMWLPELTFDSIMVAIKDRGVNMDTITLSRNKRDTYTKNLTATDNLVSNKLKPRSDLVLTLSSPIAAFDAAKISLLEDSVAVTGLQVSKLPSSERKYSIKYPWRNERDYILRLAEAAFTDNFGTKSKPYTKSFTLDSDDSYGNLSVAVTVADSSANNYVVELLNEAKNVLRADTLSKDTTLNYLNYPVGKYKIRVVYDENKNGKWDTGNVKEKRQPEKIWNYDKEIILRPNWDLEEKITIPKDE